MISREKGGKDFPRGIKEGEVEYRDPILTIKNYFLLK
jgi:hypothetical protein